MADGLMDYAPDGASGDEEREARELVDQLRRQREARGQKLPASSLSAEAFLQNALLQDVQDGATDDQAAFEAWNAAATAPRHERPRQQQQQRQGRREEQRMETRNDRQVRSTNYTMDTWGRKWGRTRPHLLPAIAATLVGVILVPIANLIWLANGATSIAGAGALVAMAASYTGLLFLNEWWQGLGLSVWLIPVAFSFGEVVWNPVKRVVAVLTPFMIACSILLFLGDAITAWTGLGVMPLTGWMEPFKTNVVGRLVATAILTGASEAIIIYYIRTLKAQWAPVIDAWRGGRGYR